MEKISLSHWVVVGVLVILHLVTVKMEKLDQEVVGVQLGSARICPFQKSAGNMDMVIMVVSGICSVYLTPVVAVEPEVLVLTEMPARVGMVVVVSKVTSLGRSCITVVVVVAVGTKEEHGARGD